MEKRYHIETPEQLRAVGEFAKEGDVKQVAAVWSAAKRKKDGKVPWDKAIHALFTGGRFRKAKIIREKGECPVTLAVLKYNLALKWCDQNLPKESERVVDD